MPIFFGIVVSMLLNATTTWSYIDNLTNMSAEWVRTGNRNAATDSADIVNYNPAGVSELSQGFHLNLYSILQQRDRELTISDGSGKEGFSENDSITCFPGAFGVYNINKWSLFGGIDIPNGGTERQYSDGSVATQLAGRTILASPLIDSEYNILTPALTIALSAPPYDFVKIGDDGSGDKHIYSDFTNESYEKDFKYHISTLGFAYKFNKSLSLALGLRFANADSTTKVSLTLSDLSDDAAVMNSISPGFFPETITLESEREWIGWGTGGIFGINFNASDDLNLAMQIQTPVKLIERGTVKKDELNIFSDKKKLRNDLPGMVGIGMGYDISQKLYAEVDFNYWFQSETELESFNGKNIAPMAGDAWSTGGTFSYKLSPAFLVSLGGTYTKYEWDNLSGLCNGKTGISEDLLTDNYFLGTGF